MLNLWKIKIMKDIKQSIDFVSFQREIANIEDGRFIPFIGVNYSLGVRLQDSFNVISDEKESSSMKYRDRILVIGARHYCDAIYDSRNLLGSLSNDVRKKLQITQPKDLSEIQTGCLEDNSLCCLKKYQISCPGYKNSGRNKCPIYDSCKIREIKDGNFECKNQRNLKCETQYAIIENYRDKNKLEIEPTGNGKAFFSSVYDFLKDNLSLTPILTERELWESIAFFNLIQRYIPYRGVYNNNSQIKSFLKEEDIEFAKIIIEKLEPTIILTTMPFIISSLRDVFIDLGYNFDNIINFQEYNLITRKKGKIKGSSLKNFIYNKISKYTFPRRTIDFKEDMIDLLENFKNHELTQRFSSKNKIKVLREMVLDSLIERIEKEPENVPDNIKKLKSFDEANNDKYETFRKYLSQKK